MMKANKTLHRLAAAASQRAKEKAYWLKKLSGEWTKSCFPCDYCRTGAGNRGLEVEVFEFSHELSSRLIQLSGGSDARLHIVLAAGLNALLYRYMGMNISSFSDMEAGVNKAKAGAGTDIIVGTPILKSGKEADLINTLLVLRTPVNPGMTFRELVLATRQTVLEAIENQNYPLEILIRQLNLSLSPGDDFPLFGIAILVENIHDRKYLNPVNLDMIFSFSRCESSIKGRLEYNPLFYRETGAGQIIKHYKQLLAEAVADVDITLSGIEIISEEEKKQLLVDFNDTTVEYPREKTIQELFTEQAKRIPDHIAIVGARHAVPANGGVHLTYRELNRESGFLARVLREKGVLADSIVGIMLDRSVEMIIGILGILKAGGAYLPIDPDYPRERIDFMLKDSGAKILLTELPEGPELHHSSNQFIIHNCHNLAYVIYTSGTTGKPKGVLTGHYNVTRVVRDTNYIDITGNDRLLQLSNYAFDGSVFDIYGALLNGAVLVMIGQEDVSAVGRLAAAIKREAITVFFVTTALFNILVDLDIGCLAGIRKVLFGGERVSVEHSRRALEYLGKDRIIHVYGPTETTVYATYYFIDGIDGPAGTIPIGKPISNTTVYIVDNSLRPVPIGVSGEVYIGGAGVARGYLNQPELTAEKFISAPASSSSSSSSWGLRLAACGCRLYKTGDLARWLVDGNIEFTGRIDLQVKIRGFRIEPGEIESRLLNHNRVQEALVLVREDSGGDKYLCAYVVVVAAARQAFNARELREYLSGDLPDYMVPAYIVILDRMPLNVSGKIDRAALPVPGVGAAGGHAYTAPGSPLEQGLVKIWSEVLKVNREHLGIDANFIEMGGHSLKATLLVAKIHKAFAVDVPLAEVFARPTIRELAGYIGAAKQDKYLSIGPTELKEYYPLSSAQKRLYILQQLDVNSTAYNIPEFMTLAGNLDTDRLEFTFKELIARHESLRTCFAMMGDDPVQRIHDGVEFAVDYNDGELPVDFIRPFDLSRAPLFRVGLVREGGMRYNLMVDMHHIISDGTSVGVLVREFMALYQGEGLPLIRIQYKDFSEWQNRGREKEAIKKQERYWLREFAGEIPVLNFISDYARPVLQDFGGETIAFQIGREQAEELGVLAVKEDASLYMVLLTLYNILLSKLSGQGDIVVGCPVAGRRHGDLENIIGMFVNTLALRNYPAGEKGVIQFLRETRERTLAAFENQEYQFEDLVDRLAVNRDAGRNPLFDVVLVMQNLDIPGIQIPGLKLSPFVYENKISKFDMTWTAAESENGIVFSVNYCTKLFKMETMNRLTGYFKKIIVSILENPGVLIEDIEIITEEEKEQVLYGFNDTGAAYPHDKTIHELFAGQAEQTPDHVALIGPEGEAKKRRSEEEKKVMHFTYKELNEKSNGLAGLLIEKGIQSDTIVGIMVERSVEMIIGILGILKSGGAYLPIDPGYPRERIDYMLKDSGAKILLTELPEGPELHHSSNQFIIHNCNNLAYVIYTSGTTGRPKGTMINHGSLVNQCTWHSRYYRITGSDRSTQYAGIGFDAAVFEIFPYLTKGAALHIISDAIKLDLRALKEYFNRNRITVAFLPTQFCRQFMAEETETPSLRTVITGGEKLDRFLKRSYRLYNNYGPTENTVVAAACPVDREYDNIPIGKPVHNNRIYILDKNSRRPRPMGVPGELCISGASLSRGYLNRPGLTNEKFLRGSRGQFLQKEPPGRRRHPTAWGPYKRIYKTGDLARWLPDGNIEFLGRLDHQVKIRGFRVELGEIQNRLLDHEAVKEAVVVDVGDGGGDKSLCAYIVVNREFEDIVDAGEFREHLSPMLPDYMVPSFFVLLEKLPLTPNGKLDRKALPIPGKTRSYLKTTYVQPETEMEKIVADTWKEVLGVDKVGLNDNFFELGGNSLNIVQLAGKLNKVLERDIPTVTMFRYPKIGSFLEYLNGMGESEGEEKVKAGVSGTGRSGVVEKGKDMMRRSLRQRRRH